MAIDDGIPRDRELQSLCYMFWEVEEANKTRDEWIMNWNAKNGECSALHSDKGDQSMDLKLLHNKLQGARVDHARDREFYRRQLEECRLYYEGNEEMYKSCNGFMDIWRNRSKTIKTCALLMWQSVPISFFTHYLLNHAKGPILLFFFLESGMGRSSLETSGVTGWGCRTVRYLP